ncbi:hypothetical protein Gorai_009112, partial [Gossypium raimondii]|nr:hypothetical protein [Gossypium raimondii]
ATASTAIKILSNGALPLWAGVLITASDCFIFLFLENYGVRKLEAFFAVLIATMAVSFAWMFGETKPSGTELLHVQSREIDRNKKGQVQEALNYYSIESTAALIISFIINLFVTTVFAKAFYDTEVATGVGLGNAGQYLEEKYGGGILPILYIWAIGLLAAGQSSTITGTYAGQFIMGGFLKLKLKKWSFQIPFALIPLLCLVSKEQIMGAFRIGHVLKTVAWIVAALVIVINGYLLLNFFSSEAFRRLILPKAAYRIKKVDLRHP